MGSIYDSSTFQINKEEFIKFAEETQNNSIPSCLDSDIISTKDRFVFYLLDIVEWNAAKPGNLYLFGKTYDATKKSYVSCCVNVKYCHKRVYLLPRQCARDYPHEEVSWDDICNEFCEQVVPRIETRQIFCNEVTKKYAFDNRIPAETDYLEVMCKVGNFKLRDKYANTYSRTLGTYIGYQETFVLERNIKGPCWLEITNYQTNIKTSSQCKINIECHDIQDITPITRSTSPPIIMMGLDFRTIKNKEKNEEHIISVSCIVEAYTECDSGGTTTIIEKFCIFSVRYCTYKDKLVEEYVKSCSHMKVRVADDEIHLLSQLIACIHSFDPDVLYGHNMIRHNVDLIYSKIEKNQMWLKNFNKLPKVGLSRVPSAKYKMDLFIGRILCDTMIMAEEMVKSRSYSIHDLSLDHLKIPHYAFEIDSFKTVSQNINYLPDFLYTIMWDITCLHKFINTFNVIHLLIEISRLCGNTLKSCAKGFLSERCEYLLMHKFYEKNYIIPNKFINRHKQKKATIIGGLVLEPDIGLHKDFILALDFNSLYPSIIQEYNVCFTTITKDDVDADGEGVLPELITELINRRKDILHELSTITCDQPYNYIENLKIKQRIIKRITNSIYGYIGCNGARFMAEHLANFVTDKGRKILMHTVALLTDNSHNVVYGDTDSVMIETNLKTYQEVEQLSKKLCELINSQYNYVNIEQAGIYKPFLILKKKKYAGMEIKPNGSCNEEIKGLEMIRRDWSGISSLIANKVLNYILTDQPDLANVIYDYLQIKREDLMYNYRNYNDELFIICKKLSKDPEKYKNKDNYEHIKVAWEYNKKHPNTFKANDIVCYVVCVDGSPRCYTDRVYHIEEYRKSNHLKIDIEYYISHQIYPVVKRICEGAKDILCNEDLLSALDVDLNKEKAVVEQKTKRLKIDVEPKLNPLNYFTIVCIKCRKDRLISYDSCDYIKFCNCQTNKIPIFRAHLSMLVSTILRTYKTRNRTFGESKSILSKIRAGLVKNKKSDKCLSEYLKIVDNCMGIISKDYYSQKVDLCDMFKHFVIPVENWAGI